MVTEKSVRATPFAWFPWKKLLLKSHLSGLKTFLPSFQFFKEKKSEANDAQISPYFQIFTD